LDCESRLLYCPPCRKSFLPEVEHPFHGEKFVDAGFPCFCDRAERVLDAQARVTAVAAEAWVEARFAGWNLANDVGRAELVQALNRAGRAALAHTPETTTRE
jgi:hypothetical protein